MRRGKNTTALTHRILVSAVKLLKELASAAQRVINDDVPATTANLQERMYLPDLPPVDVLVRTSGEMRISNFLLWQIAGSKVYFTDKAWPDFDERELDAALSLLR